MSSTADTLREENNPPKKTPSGRFSDQDFPVWVIERRPGWQFFDLRELWRYRELLVFLVWRDLKVRYKQTFLGVTWAIVQPFAIMVVFSLFLHRLGEISTGALEYPLFVYSGILPWTFFANAVGAASGSIVGSGDMITKVYFPRIIIPLGAVTAALVDFAVASSMLLGLMLFYGRVPGWGVLLVPLLALGLMIVAVGIGTLLAALTVTFRDFRHIVPFVIQLWMFATPTIYMKEHASLNPRWGMVLPLNPVDGLITNFRAAALGTEFDLQALAVSCAVGLVLFLIGCLYFRHVERSFADII